ncbi:MAG: YbjN domain-containing protein [Pseudomonadota bacterium]
MKLLISTLATLTISGVAATAGPGAADPLATVTALQDLGFRAQYEPSESNNRPRIRSSTAGINFSIWYYGCDETMTNCDTLLFSAGFDFQDGSTLAVVNTWNDREVLGRAFLDDENDPLIDLALPEVQEMSTDELESILELWEDIIIEYTEEIGFNR